MLMDVKRDESFMVKRKDSFYQIRKYIFRLYMRDSSPDSMLFKYAGTNCPQLFFAALIFLYATGCTKQPPYPPSSIIKKVTFAPVSSIVRKAEGSDNWPITWGDDDNQYTAYGDGRGFEPKTERKLSLGFAKIEGPPDEFSGVNIRSVSGEREGDGKYGPKASGLLMVEGVLYMWVRNTGNSTLAWSDDKAGSWQWGFRFTTSFGCPAFLNAGRNYQGAKDDYVYVYSQDGSDAYEPYDRIVLARATKSKITDYNAYQFFERFDKDGNPVWTSDINNRGAVFQYPGKCQRIDVVYNPGIKRYLMAVGYNHRGGWGIFDAPEPWGPWSTAFHTCKWDVKGTHSYRLPAKWIEEEGKTMSLVFSGVSSGGYDAFCVRKLSITLREQD